MPDDAGFGELLGRVRHGDESACADLVRLYEPEVRRFVRYRLNAPRLRRLLDSADICQSVFAKFFVRLAGGDFDLQSPRQLQRLLVTMAANKLLDHARRQGTARRGGGTAAGGPPDTLADPALPPDRTAEARDVAEVVRSRLSDDELVVLDRWMQGQDWPEIAGAAGASPDAVRKRLTRALDRVARDLGWADDAPGATR